MKISKLNILIALIAIYVTLKLVPYSDKILYPINLIVTFLHEFWHAFFAIITWWSVESIKINSDWSWVTLSSWWIRTLVIMWWYIWSAIFWNLLLYYWLKWDKTAKYIMYVLGWLMIFSSIFWFNWIVSSIIQILIGIVLIVVWNKTNQSSIILPFIGFASLIYIIQDFNVWPTSDLAQFSNIFIIIPQFVWMYLWLFIVVWLSWYNLKLIVKEEMKK
jgi:hypothetical protein